MARASQYGIYIRDHIGTTVDNSNLYPSPERWTVYEKLRMRLGMGMNYDFPFHCCIHEGPNTVFVFVAKDDKALILEDDRNLFPSDSLIGQLGLFTGSL